MITTLVVTEGTAVINLAGQTYVCSNLYPGYLTQKFNGFSVAFGSYADLCYFPSLFTVTFCTTLSCTIFKKNYTGGSDDLNRRIISLPIVLPLTLVIPTLLSTSILAVVERWLTSSRPFDYPYWVIFTRFISFQAYEIISRVVYPFILLLLNKKIGKNWKTLLFMKCHKKSTQVGPIHSSSTSDNASTNSTNIAAVCKK